MALIVIVEDDPDNRYALERVLRQLGHDVISADNGLDAIQFIRDHKPQLVITDHEMPRMSGVDLAQAIRAEAAISHIPVVMVSASPEMNFSPDLLGITAHLRKPYAYNGLARVIADVLGDAAIQSEPDSEGSAQG